MITGRKELVSDFISVALSLHVFSKLISQTCIFRL